MIRIIIEGIKAYATAFKLIRKLKLWTYFSIPVLISLVVGGSIAFLTCLLAGTIGSFIAEVWIWNWGKETFAAIASLVGGLLVIAIGFVLYKHIVMALVSPFMSPVSEKIEAYYLQENGIEDKLSAPRKTSFNQQLARGIRINIRNLGRELFFTVILLLLSLIPFVNLVTTPLLFLMQSYYSGFGNLDFTLERHFNYNKSISFVRENRGIAIGNGIVFTLLLLIPIVGFIIVLPLSVTASSIKALEKIHQNE